MFAAIQFIYFLTFNLTWVLLNCIFVLFLNLKIRNHEIGFRRKSLPDKIVLNLANL